MKRSLINQPFLTETGEFELEERERGEGGGGRGTKDGGWRRNDFKGTWGIGEGVQSRQTSLKLYNPSSGSHLARANHIMHYQKIGT